LCHSLDFECVRRGPGFWHLDNDLLSNVLFQADIEHFWSKWQNKVHLFDNPLVWWDSAKLHFKTIAIKRAKIRGKLWRHEHPKLERKLERLQVKAYNGNNFEIEQHDRGIISSVFKKGDRTLRKNWLTTDYKILMKALANRLQ